MKSLDASTGVPLYLQVARLLKEDIAAGRYSEGDAVPSLRVASSELRVNIHTIGKAYALLEREGVLSRRRGDAFRVAAIPGTAVDLIREDVETLLDRAAGLKVSADTVVELVEEAVVSRARREA